MWGMRGVCVRKDGDGGRIVVKSTGDHNLYCHVYHNYDELWLKLCECMCMWLW